MPVNFGKPFSTLSHGQWINNVGLKKFPGYETIGAVFKIQLVNLASRPPIFKEVSEYVFHNWAGSFREGSKFVVARSKFIAKRRASSATKASHCLHSCAGSSALAPSGMRYSSRKESARWRVFERSSVAQATPPFVKRWMNLTVSVFISLSKLRCRPWHAWRDGQPL